jgi:hypothetical protein
MPRVEKKPEPLYSVGSGEADCVIVLRAVFDRKGKVTNIKFIEARSEKPNGCAKEEVKTFKKDSIAAAREIKFVPAMKDGQPVSMWMQLEYGFSLEAAKKN